MSDRKTVVFLTGVPSDRVHKTKEPINDRDFEMFQQISDQLDVNFYVMMAVPDIYWAGNTKVPIGRTSKKTGESTPQSIRWYRQEVIDKLNEIKPDVVMVCGPVALKCISNKATFSSRDHMRESLHFDDLPDIPCVVTHSLEQIQAKPGVAKWIRLDTMAGVNGQLGTEWGDYTIITPRIPCPSLIARYPDFKIHANWNTMPPEYKGVTEIGFDLETFPGLDPHHPDARIRMAVVSRKLGEAHIVQAKPNSTFPKWLTDLAADPNVKCSGSNIKFDYKWMNVFGYSLTNMYDTSTAQHILDGTDPFTDLKSLTFLYAAKLGDYSKGHRTLVKERGGWEFVADNEQYDYCGADGEASIAAMQQQIKLIKQEGLQRPLDLSMALYEVLAQMETAGARISENMNHTLERKFKLGLVELRDEILSTLGPVNPNSPKQLADALKKAVPTIDLSKSRIIRQLSPEWYRLGVDGPDDDSTTDKATLEREADKHPIIATLLKYRRYSKLYGTYVESLRDKHVVTHVGSKAWYVHTTYRPDRAETYRLAAQAPPLQQIPRKPEPDDLHPIPLDLNVKRQYISRFGPKGKIMEADLAQAEVRLAAHVSQDAGLIRAINAGDDLHRDMASLVMGINPDEVTKLQRTHIKKTTFGTIFGIGPVTLSKQCGITREAAKILIHNYFTTFSGLKECIDQSNLHVKRDLYSESIFGYKRRFREPSNWEENNGKRIMRQAWNHKVQNSAACCVFAAMIDVSSLMQLAGLKSILFMQVHDSLVLDIYPGELDKVARIVKMCMEKPDLARWGVELTIPLVVDIEVGRSWGDKKPYTFKE